MKTLTVKDIRSYYHDYLLSIHKNWNRTGTHGENVCSLCGGRHLIGECFRYIKNMF